MTQDKAQSLESNDSLVERLARRVGATATASAAFGPVVERDGITVLPVARTGFGFGAREGSRDQGSENGGGGGGVYPLGYIEIAAGRASFHPIHDPLVVGVAATAAGMLTMWALRALGRRS